MTIFVVLILLLSDSAGYSGDPPPDDDQTAGQSSGQGRPAGPGAESEVVPEPGDPAPGLTEEEVREQD